MQVELILLLFAFLMSGIFSSSEIAFLVANRLKLEVRARKQVTGAAVALSFTKEPGRYFSTLLVGNNIANVACSSLAAALFGYLFGWGEFTILLVVSFSLLLFGEILPKAIARDAADTIIIPASLFIALVRYFMYPFVWFSEQASFLILKVFGVRSETINELFTRSDIDHLIKESSLEGEVAANEGEMLTKAMLLAEQPVREVMIPRTEIVALDQAATIREALRVFRHSGYSRLPVYKETLDMIVGVVYAHDMFHKPRTLKKIMREVFFIPDSKKSADLLRDFRRRGVTIAIVVDEYGGTAGLVTTEDIIEELVGEIHDEYDVEEVICQKLGDRTYLLSGRVEIDYLNETFNLSLPVGDYETIGGYLFQLTGRIPAPREIIVAGDCKFTVKEANKTRIHLVTLEVMPVESN